MKKLTSLIAGLLLVASVSQAQKLTLEQFATKLKAAKNAQVLDARTREEFAQNHLPDAVNVDVKAGNYQAQLQKLDKKAPTFVYAIANGRSEVLAKELRADGFADVSVLPGGISNWLGSGYPIVSNTKKGVSLTRAQYNELTGSADYVLVDFGSKYCGSCRKLIPVLDSLQKANGFAPKIVRVEVYDNTALTKDLKVNVLPTIILYQHNKEAWRRQGFSSTKQVKDQVAQTISKTKNSTK